MQAPAATRVLQERGQHVAEVQVFLDSGEVARLSGPARRARQEALKDCLEMRRVGVKSTHDASLFQLRQLVKELKQQTWTVKDLGGRMLDGAEGPPPGYVMPRGAAAPDPTATPVKPVAATGRGAAAVGRGRGIVKGQASSPECLVEVADVWEATLLGSGAAAPGDGGDWEAKAEVLLRKVFARFGPVLEVRANAGGDEKGGPVACVRFASAKAAEAALVKSKRGFLPLQGDRLVRVRQPSAVEAVWRRFPKREQAPAQESDGMPCKKRMRPNERFAPRGPAPEAADESEAFWDAQHERRGAPAEPLPQPEVPPELQPEAAPGPEKPEPSAEQPGASAEDQEVCRGEREVASAMVALLDAPFSQRRKRLKALRVQWHPDKNPEERKTIATRVFQFIQAHDEWLTHHEIT
mmetsp:Transcript_159745/g.508468  ORF Transcript_159745/g.508468 Transcript_159745/m.508468 type:complete len:409 (-) Transcript_159745:722-1948(-)